MYGVHATMHTNVHRAILVDTLYSYNSRTMYLRYNFSLDGTLLEKTCARPPMSTKTGAAWNRELLREQQERALFNTMSWRLRTNLFAQLPPSAGPKRVPRSSASAAVAWSTAPRLEPENAGFESGALASSSGSSSIVAPSAAEYVLEFFERVVPLIAHLRDPSTAAVAFEDPLCPAPGLRAHVHQLLKYNTSAPPVLSTVSNDAYREGLDSITTNSGDLTHSHNRWCAGCGDRVLPRDPYSLFVYLQI